MERKKLKRREKRRDFLRSLCFLSPSLLGVGLFFVLPFCVVVYYSVIDGVVTKNFVGLSNFVNLIHNFSFQQATKHTLQFSVLAVPLGRYDIVSLLNRVKT